METDTIPIEEKHADTAAQLEIDGAILDYLAYSATKAVLGDFKKSRDSRVGATRKPKCCLQLDLVDCKLLNPSLSIRL